MSDALIIRIGREGESVEYLLVDSAGGRLGAVLSGSLSQAAPLAATRRVVVLIPGTEVIAAEPELPAKNASRLAQLAPFALEEQLAADIDSMHFAIGKRAANGRTPLAAVARARFESWLTLLASAGIQPNAVYSESSVIPGTAAVTLIVDRNLVYARHRHSPGFVLDAQPLDAALELALGATIDEGGEQRVLQDLQVYATQSDYDANGAAFDALSERNPGVQIKLLPEGPLPLFALETVNATPVNFLCGPYERKSSLSASLAPWRYAAALLGIVAILHLGYSGVRIWQSSRAERTVDKQISELVTQTLPGATLKDTRDARKQFESRLVALKQGGGRDELLVGLSALGEAVSQSPESRIEAVNFRENSLDLRVTAPTVDALVKFQQAASVGGVTAKLQSTNERDKKVEGRLQLKSGA